MVICCIGTPKVIGDSVAPRVADILINGDINAYVYGTSNRPITALNYTDYFAHIQHHHAGEFVIAIDCALGKKSSIGTIRLVREGVSPGKALGKSLSSIGNIGILGQVGDIKKDAFSELKNAPQPLIDTLVAKICSVVLDILKFYDINTPSKSRSHYITS